MHSVSCDRAQDILNEGKEGDMPEISWQKWGTVVQGPCVAVRRGQVMRKGKGKGTYRGLEMVFVHTAVFPKNFFFN